jgi:Flp pilus assembly protein TadB
VPLSEHEQRQLEQIEQALYREDPKFGRRVRSSDPRVHHKRKLVQALIGVLIGAGLVAAGVVTHRVYLEAAGAAVLVLSLLWAVVNWRQHSARTRKARSRTAGRPDRRRPPAGGRSSLMERLEERWRRRQEGDRQM